MDINKNGINLTRLFSYVPTAVATVKGSGKYPNIEGTVRFYQTAGGVVVLSEIFGLPRSNDACRESPVFGFHIHEGASCTGNNDDSFADVGMHYNPDGCPHPYHAGDMPPLFGVGGMAFSAFLTDRFSVDEIVGRTVIIHGSPDDFTTQPSGNSGEKIACGRIVRTRR